MKEQLLQARDLIQAQRYAEARALLRAIEHPKAQEWLAKLDELDPPEPVPPTQEAVDLADLFVAAPPTSADAPLNSESTHQRLIEARDLIKAHQYAAAGAKLRGVEHPTADKMRHMLREVEAQRLQAARQWRSVLRGLIFVLGVSAILAIVVFVGLRDAVYEDPLLRFTYRFPYYVQPTCSTPLTSCNIELAQYFTPNAKITFAWQRLPVPTNVGVLRDEWTEKFDENDDWRFLNMMTLPESRYPTLFIQYTSNHNGAPHEVLYHTEYLLIKNNDLIQFRLVGQAAAFQQYEPDFERWFTTLEFRQ